MKSFSNFDAFVIYLVCMILFLETTIHLICSFSHNHKNPLHSSCILHCLQFVTTFPPLFFVSCHLYCGTLTVCQFDLSSITSDLWESFSVKNLSLLLLYEEREFFYLVTSC
ncbi:hypothetical protein SAY87_006100 [Trapa incisa]|uniref:Uncharacterized protein n=1 Tax=Trapa incisa TaxID=236973 RepID=A0AAN7Q859_9MYRT|nr:hypothetical protein SAY87_006100 [Trapa incisa]